MNDNPPRSAPESALRAAEQGPLSLEQYIRRISEDFNDSSQEWRRLFSELLGTFFLVLVAAGGGMMGQAFPNTISRTAAVVAPALMVMAIILFMGKVSGAHLNPAVSIAFALRGDFPWRRVPGYIVVQLSGAALAAWFLQGVIHVSATYGSNYPAVGFSGRDAFFMETVLTFGLVSVILGTASGAQNLGVFGALGVGGYIALAGLWGSPISGASMNPARPSGPISSAPTSANTGSMSPGRSSAQPSRSASHSYSEAPAEDAPAPVPRKARSSPKRSARTRRRRRRNRRAPRAQRREREVERSRSTSLTARPPREVATIDPSGRVMLPVVDSSSLVVVAGIFLTYAVFSRRLLGTWITAPIVFVGAGFVFGSEGLGWLHLTLGQHAVSMLAEATLVVVLFTDASRIDFRALRREYTVPARLLGVGLPLTIVVGTLAGALVLHSVTWAEAAVLAIVLAPTDAALGQAVVTDESLPSRIRQGLNVESGLNDGLCVPLLTIALAVAQTDAGDITASHATKLVVEAIGWGIVGGLVAGVVAAYALRGAQARGWIEGHWIQIVPVIAAVGAFAIADAHGGSGFIAAFVGGAVFGRISGRDANAAAFSEETGGVLNGATLIVFGAAVLGSLWSQIGLVEVVYAVLSLTVVRMIPVAISMLGAHARPPTVLFLGWFGPRGLASIVFGVVVVEAAGLPHTSELVVALTVTVALSVFAHGITAAPLAKRYAAWHARSASPMESAPAPHQRWRHSAPLTP